MTEQLRPDNDLALRWHDVHKKHRTEKDRIRELVKEYLSHVPTENEYLRRKGEELLTKIAERST